MLGAGVCADNRRPSMRLAEHPAAAIPVCCKKRRLSTEAMSATPQSKCLKSRGSRPKTLQHGSYQQFCKRLHRRRKIILLCASGPQDILTFSRRTGVTHSAVRERRHSGRYVYSAKKGWRTSCNRFLGCGRFHKGCILCSQGLCLLSENLAASDALTDSAFGSSLHRAIGSVQDSSGDVFFAVPDDPLNIGVSRDFADLCGS